MCNSFVAKDDAGEQTMHPGATVPVVIGLSPQRTERMAFGIPVEWKPHGGVINARIESLVRDEGMWAGALASQRCLVPCERFFETHRSERAASPRTRRTVKQRYSFAVPDDRTLLLAAVHQDGGFAVVTTEPNEAVAPVHDRMPLVLTEEEARSWLDPDADTGALACLADRSGIELRSAPELPPVEEAPQLLLPI